MVLADLGSQLTGAFRKLNAATVVDDDVIEDCLKEICNALMKADVNIREVMGMKSEIKVGGISFVSSTCTGASSALRDRVLDLVVDLVVLSRVKSEGVVRRVVRPHRSRSYRTTKTKNSFLFVPRRTTPIIVIAQLL